MSIAFTQTWRYMGKAWKTLPKKILLPGIHDALGNSSIIDHIYTLFKVDLEFLLDSRNIGIGIPVYLGCVVHHQNQMARDYLHVLTVSQKNHFQGALILDIYRKPPNISPGLIFVRKHFLVGLYMGGLIYGQDFVLVILTIY